MQSFQHIRSSITNIQCNNIHAKISAFWLAKSMSINPKQCRKLKLSAKKKNEIKNDWQLWLLNRSRAMEKQNGGQKMKQQYSNSITELNKKSLKKKNKKRENRQKF